MATYLFHQSKRFVYSFLQSKRFVYSLQPFFHLITLLNFLLISNHFLLFYQKSPSLMGSSSPIFSPSSDKRFWSTLRILVDSLLENQKPIDQFVHVKMVWYFITLWIGAFWTFFSFDLMMNFYGFYENCVEWWGHAAAEEIEGRQHELTQLSSQYSSNLVNHWPEKTNLDCFCRSRRCQRSW